LIIVDDLDRCDLVTIQEVVKFFNEIFSMDGCVLFYLINLTKIKLDQRERMFFEKYFHQRYDLAKVDNISIMNYFLENNIFLNIEFRGKLNDKTNEQLKDHILSSRFYNEVFVNDIKSRIKKIRELLSKLEKDQEVARKKYEDELNKLKKIAKDLNRKITNTRYVKRYFREFEACIMILNDNWFLDINGKNSEYNKKNWLEYASRITFMKVFLENKYEKVLMYYNFLEYYENEDKNEKEFVLKILGIEDILGLKDDESYIVDKLIYKMYVKTTNKDKPKEQQIRECIENSKYTEDLLVDVFEYFIANWNKYSGKFDFFINDLSNFENDKIAFYLINFIELIAQRTAHTRNITIEVFKNLCNIYDKVNDRYNIDEIKKISELLYLIGKHYIFGSGNEFDFFCRSCGIKLTKELREKWSFSNEFEPLIQVLDELDVEKGNHINIRESVIESIEKTAELYKDSDKKRFVVKGEKLLLNKLKISKYLMEKSEKISNSITEVYMIDEKISEPDIEKEIEILQKKTREKQESDFYKVEDRFIKLCSKIEEKKSILPEKIIDALIELQNNFTENTNYNNDEINHWDYNELRIQRIKRLSETQ
jgi:hypothetical protein